MCQGTKLLGLDTRAEQGSVRETIEDLLLIWHLTESEEWMNRLEWLPL